MKNIIKFNEIYIVTNITYRIILQKPVLENSENFDLNFM
jgi:hypothetical protein